MENRNNQFILPPTKRDQKLEEMSREESYNGRDLILIGEEVEDSIPSCVVAIIATYKDQKLAGS
jgi:hypothetical protein